MSITAPVLKLEIPIFLMPTRQKDTPKMLLMIQFVDEKKSAAKTPPSTTPTSSTTVMGSSSKGTTSKGCMTLFRMRLTRWSKLLPTPNMHMATMPQEIAFFMKSVPKYRRMQKRPKRTQEPITGNQYASSACRSGDASLVSGGSVNRHTACFEPSTTHRLARVSRCRFGCKPAHVNLFAKFSFAASACDVSIHSAFSGWPMG
mmetsp:Transcript_29212/g.82960  ORF Transcript_29212/g.82960 Transcript_29212/m.82960 type:complete len:202 (+) Transcript_29212:572-1177(+)